MSARALKLINRAVLRISGSDAISFLNGLVTNDVATVKKGPVYAALLTPQGKFMYDMIIVADGDDLLLDTEAVRKQQLMQRLMMYKLRANVTISEEDTSVWAVWDAQSKEGISYIDPRDKALKSRVINKDNPYPSADVMSQNEYEECRIRRGVPDGSRDMMVEKYFWLETAAEKLNGVSFTKGCFIGQELTARMKHRTTLKKMLVPVQISEPCDPKTVIKTTEGKSAGIIHTSSNGYALAYMRLEHINSDLIAGNAVVSPIKSDD